VVEKVRGLKPGEGLNAADGEYGDLVAAGVIDPTMVTRSALQNAARSRRTSSPPRRSSLSAREGRRRRNARWRHARHGGMM